MTDNELGEYIQKRMEITQSSFDNTKSTFLTAGLLVAASLGIHELSVNTIYGKSGIKVLLALTIMSALCQMLSFVFAEHQVKRHDKLMGGIITTWQERLLLKNAETRAKILPWFYGKLHNFLITLFNNLATAFLILGLLSFLYLLVK